MWRSSVGSALTCCKAGPCSILGSAPHGEFSMDLSIIDVSRLLLLSGEAMKIQEEGPRQMIQDELMYDCIV